MKPERRAPPPARPAASPRDLDHWALSILTNPPSGLCPNRFPPWASRRFPAGLALVPARVVLPGISALPDLPFALLWCTYYVRVTTDPPKTVTVRLAANSRKPMAVVRGRRFGLSAFGPPVADTSPGNTMKSNHCDSSGLMFSPVQPRSGLRPAGQCTRNLAAVGWSRSPRPPSPG